MAGLFSALSLYCGPSPCSYALLSSFSSSPAAPLLRDREVFVSFSNMFSKFVSLSSDIESLFLSPCPAASKHLRGESMLKVPGNMIGMQGISTMPRANVPSPSSPPLDCETCSSSRACPLSLLFRLCDLGSTTLPVPEFSISVPCLASLAAAERRERCSPRVAEGQGQGEEPFLRASRSLCPF